MPVILRNYDTDKIFEEVSTVSNVTVINDVSIDTKDDREEVLSSLYTKYTETSIDGVPICSKGCSKGEYLLNTICPTCNTYIISPFDKLENKVWLRTLSHVKAFINPIFYRKVDRTMGTIRTANKQGRRTNTIPFMLWLSDPTFKVFNFPETIEFTLIGKPTLITESNIHLLKNDNIINNQKGIPNTPESYLGKTVNIGGLEHFKRDYTYMLDHLPEILKKISLTTKYRNKRDILLSLATEYVTNKSAICSKHLPVISDKMFVMEKTTSANYVDMKLGDLTNVILNYLKAINKNPDTNNLEASNNITTARVVAKLSENIDEYINTYIAHKEGIGRKHIYSSRNQFVFRYVITPIHGPSKYNEIHVPWSVGLVTYKLHLFNKMKNDEEVKRLGWGGKQILHLLETHVHTYHPVIDRLLKEMITDTKHNGICVAGLRNPGLLPGSIQRQYITKFKTDPLDQTVSISILSTTAQNADFDKLHT